MELYIALHWVTRRIVVLIGLLLIAVAAGFTTDVFLQNSAGVDLDVFGRSLTISPGWIVVAGIAALAVFILGTRLVALGVGRARRHKSLLRDAEAAARERDDLAQQLAAEREHNEEGTTPVESSQHPADGPVPSSVD